MLGDLRLVSDATKDEMRGGIVIAPPSALNDRWSRRLPEPVTAMASGWMRVRGRARQRGVEVPLVISDHADWSGLLATVKATGAEKVHVTHGQTAVFSKYLNELGIEAYEVKTNYGDDEADETINSEEQDTK